MGFIFFHQHSKERRRFDTEEFICSLNVIFKMKFRNDSYANEGNCNNNKQLHFFTSSLFDFFYIFIT